MPLADNALLATLIVTLVVFTGIWLINVRIEDAGIVDYYWGPGFAVIGAITAWINGISGLPQGLFLAAVIIWAFRLASHLIARHRKSTQEDARYRAMREDGGPSWWWKSLFTVFLMQGLLLWIIAAPVHLALRGSAAAPNGVFWLGMAIFAFGFAIEWVADMQLARARASRPSNPVLARSGLWAMSRHPNYFGEIVLWWGLALAAFALSGSWLVFAGPAILTAVIVGVSIPLTEAHLRRSRPAYEAYAREVPMLIPLPGPRGGDRQAAE